MHNNSRVRWKSCGHLDDKTKECVYFKWSVYIHIEWTLTALVQSIMRCNSCPIFHTAVMEVKKYRTDDHPNFFQFGSNGYRPDTVITKFKVTENDMIFSDAMMQLYSTPLLLHVRVLQGSVVLWSLTWYTRVSFHNTLKLIVKLLHWKSNRFFFICIENMFFKDTLIVTLIYTWYRSAEQETTSATLNT